MEICLVEKVVLKWWRKRRCIRHRVANDRVHTSRSKPIAKNTTRRLPNWFERFEYVVFYIGVMGSVCSLAVLNGCFVIVVYFWRRIEMSNDETRSLNCITFLKLWSWRYREKCLGHFFAGVERLKRESRARR